MLQAIFTHGNRAASYGQHASIVPPYSTKCSKKCDSQHSAASMMFDLRTDIHSSASRPADARGTRQAPEAVVVRFERLLICELPVAAQAGRHAQFSRATSRRDAACVRRQTPNSLAAVFQTTSLLTQRTHIDSQPRAADQSTTSFSRVSCPLSETPPRQPPSP